METSLTQTGPGPARPTPTTAAQVIHRTGATSGAPGRPKISSSEGDEPDPPDPRLARRREAERRTASPRGARRPAEDRLAGGRPAEDRLAGGRLEPDRLAVGLPLKRGASFVLPGSRPGEIVSHSLEVPEGVLGVGVPHLELAVAASLVGLG